MRPQSQSQQNKGQSSGLLQNSGLQSHIRNTQNLVKHQEPANSLELQTLLYFDIYFNWLLIILQFMFQFYKLYALPFPKGQWGMEMVFLVSFVFLQYSRITLGVQGNRTESRTKCLFMLFLTGFAIFYNVYYIRLQTYILVMEVVLHSIAIGFAGLESLLAIIVIFMIWRLESQDTNNQGNQQSSFFKR